MSEFRYEPTEVELTMHAHTTTFVGGVRDGWSVPRRIHMDGEPIDITFPIGGGRGHLYQPQWDSPEGGDRMVFAGVVNYP